MSGHSKWSTIKHKKALGDAKKGQVFSKFSKLITVAARSGSADPEMNFRLRLIIDKARAANMPADNIKRAVEKGAGGKDSNLLEEFVYEAYGPAGVALMIEGVTDNKNRTIAEVKNILARHGARLGEAGSVKWSFKKRGEIRLSLRENQKTVDEIELLAIDLGVDDFRKEDSVVVLWFDPLKVEELKKNLEENSLKILEAGVKLTAVNSVKTSKETQAELAELKESLLEHDDVNEVYTTLAPSL